jgi:hypothetical protein
MLEKRHGHNIRMLPNPNPNPYAYAYGHAPYGAYGFSDTLTHPSSVPLNLPYPARAHPGPRSTRGADIGAGGARANGDVELLLGDKEFLPVYDGGGRPPRYAPLEASHPPAHARDTSGSAMACTVEPVVEAQLTSDTGLTEQSRQR